MPDSDLPAVQQDAPPPVLATDVQDPIQLLAFAVDRGVDVDSMERLVALAERAQDRKAEREFNEALARVQAECPPIPKTRKPEDRATRSGGRAPQYMYANLPDILVVSGPLLHKHGFSWTWDGETVGSGQVETCTLRHVGGHAVSSRSPVVPFESRAGMSEQQKRVSAQTYARRSSFCGVTGLFGVDDDNDGADIPDDRALDAISDATKDALIRETEQREFSWSAFCDFFEITDLEELTEKRGREAIAMLKRKPLKGASKPEEWPKVEGGGA